MLTCVVYGSIINKNQHSRRYHNTLPAAAGRGAKRMEENMQNEYELKKLICDIGKRIYNRNMVAANDGNISVKLNDNEFLCTPTGVSKGFMTPEFICKVDAQGNVIQANKGFRPSSEIKMHLRV